MFKASKYIKRLKCNTFLAMINIFDIFTQALFNIIFMDHRQASLQHTLYFRGVVRELL